MTRRMVDLTYPMHDGMPTYPAEYHPRFEMHQVARHGIEGRETRRVSFGTHTGTHVDAPKHFIAGGESVDRLLLEAMCGPAWLVDVPFDIPGLEGAVLGGLPMPRPRRVLVRQGTGKYWGSREFYERARAFTPGLAQRLVDDGVWLVGLDAPSPDMAGDHAAHRILLDAGVVLLESLAHLEMLRPGPLELYCLPLKLWGADGAPARVIAIQDE